MASVLRFPLFHAPFCFPLAVQPAPALGSLRLETNPSGQVEPQNAQRPGFPERVKTRETPIQLVGKTGNVADSLGRSTAGSFGRQIAAMLVAIPRFDP